MCLCHTCGLRRPEAASLRVADFGHDRQAITIERSKSDASRLVAMPGPTARALAERASMLSDPAPDSFMLRGSRPLDAWSRGLYAFWHECLDMAGVGPRADGGRRRIHDLRNAALSEIPTFARHRGQRGRGVAKGRDFA